LKSKPNRWCRSRCSWN